MLYHPSAIVYDDLLARVQTSLLQVMATLASSPPALQHQGGVIVPRTH